MFSGNQELSSLIERVRSFVPKPTQGLPEEVFLFLSEISPLTNVDLLVRDSAGRVLLAWRNDPWWGNAWHVPGGIIRLQETFDDRIQKTAIEELGTRVIYDEQPLEVQQIIDRSLVTRSHHITFVYDCRVPEGYQIDNRGLSEHDTGYLAWHDKYPDNMLKCHTFYQKYFNK